MTTREERTRNLLQTGVFLKALQADVSLPKSVRNEARRLYRHYPTIGEIQLLAEVEALFGSNLITPEFDSSWFALAWGSARPQEQMKQEIAAKRRLLDRLEKSTARASSAIDDAVAYVEASNKKIAGLKKGKRK